MLANRLPRVLNRRTVRLAIPAALAVALLAAGVTSAAAAPGAAQRASKPTVVLVHGAWADGSSWSRVVARLQGDGYPVVIAPNPVRGLSADSAYLKDFLATIAGPVVLAGHSYGGAVITNAATGNTNIKALVYDDAYIPDVGDDIATLSGKDSALAPAGTNPASVFRLVPYPGAPAGVVDTYVLPDVFLTGFAADLPHAQAAVLAASQPPASLIALGEPSGTPAWRTVPSWDLVGTQDRIIPLAQQLAMAGNAHAHVVRVNSSHLSLISHPDAVADLIETAACATR
jgi:pimeloyl-ACP methyl ester carboxylesterase